VATVSVANPIVGILIGILLLDERLSRPGWHIVVAVIGLGLALLGAVAISLAREGTRDDVAGAASPDRSVATA
jgi:F0F1-type ATP synthase assembly protein I